MKLNKLLQTATISVTMALVGITGTAQATSSDGATKSAKGIVACSGNFRETSLNVDVFSRWTIHNLNESTSITLDRMRVYTASGTNIYDSDINGLAPSSTVIPFGVIGPYQTLSFKSNDLITAGFLPGNLSGNERPVKVIFNWSSTNGKRVLTPYVLLTRRGASSTDTRHARDCRSID